ncbi:fimbrial protein [Burkholderia pseudomultivorans]|uniref:fimbrial protein n=1 Tax=Burkholderia pseudomultivorans TaxID=1207504 RepID=UPI000A9673AA|nr:fimbrial protein [Burkholderia pseudomultivorans]
MTDHAFNAGQGMRKRTTGNFGGNVAGLWREARVWMVAISLVLCAFSKVSYAVDWAFGLTGTVIPANAPSGAVLARKANSIDFLCKTAECKISDLKFFNFNGTQSSIAAQSIVDGIAIVFTIDGKRYTPRDLGANTVQAQGIIGFELISTGIQIPAGAKIPPHLQGGWVQTPIQFKVNGVQTGFEMYGTLTVVNGTCKARSQTVILAPTTTQKFGDVGSTQGSQPFNVHIDDCPAGFNGVNYSISPVGGPLIGSGILPLSTGSTAAGVQVLITDPGGTPVTFGQSYPLSTYDKKTGGSYQIQMNAAYIKTGANVTPGTVNGSMIVLIDYQ